MNKICSTIVLGLAGVLSISCARHAPTASFSGWTGSTSINDSDVPVRPDRAKVLSSVSAEGVGQLSMAEKKLLGSIFGENQQIASIRRDRYLPGGGACIEIKFQSEMVEANRIYRTKTISFRPESPENQRVSFEYKYFDFDSNFGLDITQRITSAIAEQVRLDIFAGRASFVDPERGSTIYVGDRKWILSLKAGEYRLTSLGHMPYGLLLHLRKKSGKFVIADVSIYFV